MLVQYLRLGHIYPRKLLTIAKHSTITITGDRHLNCIACLVAQLHQVYSRIPTVRPLLAYYLISVDVVTVRHPSITKDKYFILFTEGKALEREVEFSAYKGGAAVYLKGYYIRRKNAGYIVIVFRLDGRKEYGRNALLAFAADNSIRLQVIPPYTSTKNGGAEVSNHIVCTTVRKIIIYTNLPPTLQTKAVRATVYILNLTPSNALRGDFPRHALDIALGRAINDDKPMLNTLRAYGTTTIVYDYTVPRRSKFEQRGQRRQLVGYEDSIYRVQIALLHKIVRLLYCQFVEDSKLAEVPGTETNLTEEFDQQFEYNIIIQARGKTLQVPVGYIVETIQDNTIVEDESFITAATDPTAKNDALDAIDISTELVNRLPALS